MRRMKLKRTGVKLKGAWCNICGHKYDKETPFVSILGFCRQNLMAKPRFSETHVCKNCTQEMMSALVADRLRGTKQTHRKGKSK